MRNSGNFQQQSLMLQINSIVRQSLVYLFATAMLTTAACTRIPVAHQQNVAERVVNTGKMQVVGQTGVGTTARYVDATSGASVEISVLSEYFSAGGRKCRRFLQGTSSNLLSASATPDRAIKGLACEDRKNGWIEIPVHSIAG